MSEINLKNMLDHVNKIKNFNGAELFGQYPTNQNGHFKIVNCDNKFYISAFLEYDGQLNKFEIFEDKEKAVNLYLAFLNKYSLDLNNF